MPIQTQYDISEQLQQVCALTGVEIETVLRRSGLPADFLHQKNTSVSADTFFRLWVAVEKESESPDRLLELALRYAHGPFVSPVFAFSCSENVELGLRQLAKFKPLIGPVHIDIECAEDALVTTFTSSDPEIELPASISLFELAYITECARTCTSEHIVPLIARAPAASHATEAIAEHLGINITNADETQIVLSSKDAQLPLITRNDTLWETIAPSLTKQLQDKQDLTSMSNRVKSVLVDALAGGTVTSEQVAKKLYTSKRSLQRRLNEEGATFQKILSETRLELSRHYLARQDLSLGEISYLLGFQDQTSFFRAYHKWTGETPNSTRDSLH
ncbi:MAG: AraC family transcriptional regulator [Granulosicoccus sp.]|nr:AraC family transcriptional regulator [Granulosicoccus sp.]